MFEQSTLSSAPVGKRLWSTVAGIGSQALIVLSLVVAPLLFPQALPMATLMTSLVAPGPPPPPPPPPPKGEVQIQPRSHVTHVLNAMQIPAVIPAHAAIIEDPPPEPVSYGVPGGVQGGVPGGHPDGIIGSILQAGTPAVAPPVAAPPVNRPAPEPPPKPIQRFREGGRVKLAEPVFRPDPTYPPLARQMRVSGTVELVGVIGVDGRIKELRVISGHPLLSRAALDAVSKWIYRPTTLNGDPVEVEAPITVTFHLNN